MKKDNFSNKQTIQVNENGVLKVNNEIIENDDLNKLKTDNIKVLILNMIKT